MNDFNENLNADIKDLKRRANTVGIITIAATLIFFAVSIVFMIAIKSVIKNFTFTQNTDSLPDNIYGGLTNLCALGIGGMLFIKLKKDSLSQQLPFNKTDNKTLLYLTAIGFSVCMLSNYLTGIFINTTNNLGFDFSTTTKSAVSNSPLEIIVYIFAVAVVPAVSEEIMFRGAIMSTLRKYGDAVAVLISAILFGLFHGNMVQIPFAFIVGLVLGWSVVYTNSMLPAILIHFSNNAFSVICSILETNAKIWSISTEALSLSINIFVIAIIAVALLCTIKISRQDHSFLSLNNYYGSLTKKEISKTIITSPLMIAAVAILVIETAVNQIF